MTQHVAAAPAAAPAVRMPGDYAIELGGIRKSYGCLLYTSDKGLMTLSCGVRHNGMRFATPLNTTTELIDEGLDILHQALTTVSAREAPRHTSGATTKQAVAA